MKKDIKYIIKRVIIAVLIILIVGFLNKCSVKALSPDIWINSQYTGTGSVPGLIYTSNICVGQCAFTWSETINEYPYTFHLGQGNVIAPTTNPDGYYFVLTPPDNSFKYYFFVWAHSAYESIHGSSLNISSVDFDYSGGGLLIKLYNEDSELITYENGGDFVYYNSFILTNKDIEKGVSPSFLEEHSIYPVRYRDEAPVNEYFRLAYTSWSDDSNYSSPLNFYPTKDLFDYLVKESSTIPFILIDGYNINQDIPVEPLDNYININGNYGNNNCNSLFFNNDECDFNRSNLVYRTNISINDLLYDINLYNDLPFVNVYSAVFKIKSNYYNNNNYAYFIFYTKENINSLVKIDIDIDTNTGDITYKYYDLDGELDSNLFYVNSFFIQNSDSDDYTNFISPFYKWNNDYIKVSYSTDNFINLNYNLNFFQSFDLYYSDIVFINVNGTAIEDFARLRSYSLLDDAFLNGGSSWVDNGIDSENNNSNFLAVLFNIIKRPLKLLNDISGGTCQNIRAILPFVNSEFYLPCMSAIYHNVLGSYYQLIYLIINCLLIYKIGVNAASAIKDIIDPTTDRIAVMDL